MVLDFNIYKMVNINEMPFGFVLEKVLLTLSSLFASCRRSTSPITNSTFRKPFTGYHRRSCGGPWGTSVSNEWTVCVIQGMFSNESLSHESVNDLYSGEFGVEVGVQQSSVFCPLLSSSSWCWNFIRVSSLLLCHGIFSTLMTWHVSLIPRRNVSSSSRHGKLAWRNGFMSTWRRPSSCSPVLALMSSRNLARTYVLFAAAVSARTPSNVRSASCISTRDATAWLNNWWLTQTMCAPDAMAWLGPLTTEQWLK